MFISCLVPRVWIHYDPVARILSETQAPLVYECLTHTTLSSPSLDKGCCPQASTAHSTICQDAQAFPHVPGNTKHRQCLMCLTAAANGIYHLNLNFPIS